MKKKSIIRAIYGGILISTFSCTWDQLEPAIECDVTIEVLSLEGTGCDASTGSFTLGASGGESPYQFVLGNESNADGIFTDFQAGVYLISVTDANDCTSDQEVTVENLDGVNLNEVLVTNAGCSSDQGVIEISATGGDEPYSFRLNDGEEQADNTFSGLSEGSYDIFVSDQFGCEATQSVEIVRISYETSIQPIMETNCTFSSCHGGNTAPNLTSLSGVQSNASLIKTHTESRYMPVGRTLSQEEIDMIGCWVDDGALDN